MLTYLRIQNYALIEQVELNFSGGFTAITGETGAGKSILLGALSLILGERADHRVLRNPEKKCLIEGHFNISKLPEVSQLLETMDHEQTNELIIRRELNPQGKSRVFIQDTPSSLQNLSLLSDLLIDVHRQFDTHDLLESREQLRIIDQVSGEEEMVNAYRKAYQQWRHSQQLLEELRKENQLLRKESDYRQFLWNELSSYNPRDGEIEQLEIELNKLIHSESLKASLQESLYRLRDGESPALVQIRQTIQTLSSKQDILPDLQDILNRMNGLYIDLKEICADLEQCYDNTDYDESKILSLNERIHEGQRLMKKHHVNHDRELVAIQQQLQAQLEKTALSDEQETECENKAKQAEKEMQELAEKLSESRKAVIPIIEHKVNELLARVGMPRASFRIVQEPIPCGEWGADRVIFTLDANRSGNPETLARAASGGELSRVMLCLKSLLAGVNSLPTLIFDEIDAGISGETAVQVAKILQELSVRHQIICITHQAQLAAKANQHFYIYKTADSQDNVKTYLRALNPEERVDILAEMLGGKSVTEQTRETVRQFMQTDQVNFS